MKVINLYGAPGAGKSTTAAGLFYMMKTEGYQVELVHEFAKVLTWGKRFTELSDQHYVFGHQKHPLHVLDGQVDYVIMDSPILLSIVYDNLRRPDTYNKPIHAGDSIMVSTIFAQSVLECYDSYHNIDIFVNRVKDYNPNGRNQTEKESDALVPLIREVLNVANDGNYKHVDGDIKAPEKILDLIRLESYFSQGCQ